MCFMAILMIRAVKFWWISLESSWIRSVPERNVAKCEAIQEKIIYC